MEAGSRRKRRKKRRGRCKDSSETKAAILVKETLEREETV